MHIYEHDIRTGSHAPNAVRAISVADLPVTPEPRPAPRPPGCTPLQVEWREWVEQTYDAQTCRFTARVIQSTPPAVTRWAAASFPPCPRDVGAWRVTLRADGVTVTALQPVSPQITSGQAAALKVLAARNGGAALRVMPRLVRLNLAAKVVGMDWEETRAHRAGVAAILRHERQRRDAKDEKQGKSRQARRRKRKKGVTMPTPT